MLHHCGVNLSKQHTADFTTIGPVTLAGREWACASSYLFGFSQHYLINSFIHSFIHPSIYSSFIHYYIYLFGCNYYRARVNVPGFGYFNITYTGFCGCNSEQNMVSTLQDFSLLEAITYSGSLVPRPLRGRAWKQG